MNCDVFYDFQTMMAYMSKLRKMSSRFFAELLKSFDITNRHAAYIMILSESDGMTMKQLSDNLCVDPARTFHQFAYKFAFCAYRLRKTALLRTLR